jgi:streptogrisin C
LAAGLVGALPASWGQVPALAQPPPGADAPWVRHTIASGWRGADGVQLRDVNGDGRHDVTTAWEQAGLVTVSLHPGSGLESEPWPTVTIATHLHGVEEAIFADVDGDGNTDVVSACECRRVVVHFGPEPSRILEPDAWTPIVLPASVDLQRWITAATGDVDGDGRLDIIGGGKASPATVGWFRAPTDPRDASAWTYQPMSDVAWTMSLVPRDVDQDQDLDVVLSDKLPIRNPGQPIRYDLRGSRWLENTGGGAGWVNHPIGFGRGEHKFLEITDVDGDGVDDVLDGVSGATYNRTYFRRSLGPWGPWTVTEIPQPDRVGHYQDVMTGDLDLDEDLDLVFSYSHAEGERSGVVWLERATDGGWLRREISGPEGTKYDNVALDDIDGDGDPDVVTSEQIEQLGVVWYENPAVSPPEPAIAAVPPAMQAALGRDLGLSPEQAADRFAREAAASRVDADLRARLGEAYAGAWLDPADQQLVVALTDPDRAGEVGATGASPRFVAHSAAELAAARERLDRAPAPPSTVIAWFVDVESNAVVVEAEPGGLPAAAEFVRASGADPAVIRVVASTERPALQYQVRAGDGWGTGVSETCTIGFTVTRIADPSIDGYVTAGHCGDAGESAFARADGAWISQGVIRGSVFPVNDYAWVETTDDWTTTRYFNRYENGLVLINGWRETAEGGTVCRSGIATGYRCGTVSAKHVTVNFPDGSVMGLTRTTACAATGDSGGPHVTLLQAQGVHVGSSGNCSSGGTSYFQPLVPILAAYQLRLKVGTGTTPPVVRRVDCWDIGDLEIHCTMSYYHPDPVQIRWTVNGVARPEWNNDRDVIGRCGPGTLTGVTVTVSNSGGSDSKDATVIRCRTNPPL